MNIDLSTGTRITSRFTLALLKDTNWYADVDLNRAEETKWGYQKGCDFLT